MNHEANRERVKAALGVEATFDMETWHDTPVQGAVCGTIACIGGTAEILMQQEGVAQRETCYGYGYDWPEVAEWMGLDRVAADKLFHADPGCDSSTTIAEACQAIDNAAEFGDPKWEEVRHGS